MKRKMWYLRRICSATAESRNSWLCADTSFLCIIFHWFITNILLHYITNILFLQIQATWMCAWDTNKQGIPVKEYCTYMKISCNICSSNQLGCRMVSVKLFIPHVQNNGLSLCRNPNSCFKEYLQQNVKAFQFLCI